ncbi:DUF803-domain-containing protein [Patellaria atrata CBS 101060]|uniref:DUF803-domain-containing protein n=1 Tax=Patellaria atrata CBS 101060 TaxID=1346257 RepID=A0A9P4VKU4_9PEZI|nr:DUF803-domain-containing protein [Patellaria atrata CBS 101060]
MDSDSDVIVTAHQLYERSGGALGDPQSRPPVFKIVGIILAISSGLFIGVSFVLKKHGLLKANVKYNEEAGEGYGYLKNVWWWTGMTLMIIGEICNFAAYAFVDAILVTPMGALSVVVTAILSSIFLKERLSFVGWVGCVNCIIGSVVIAVNAPEQSAVATIQDMKDHVIAPGFLSYTGVVIVGSAIVALYLGPKYGKKSMFVYISVCSFIGGLSVVATQGLGAALITQIGGTPQFNQWFTYFLLVFVIITLLVEIVYLNKALNIFNAALVTPTYYVIFTSCTIVTSAILFQGFKGTAMSILTVILGFLQICTGVVLLQLSKSSKDVPDTVVFSGELDQVRTVAEQKEPEYEPRADTIRGGASLLRSISRVRSQRVVEEAKTIQEERLVPVGENEVVEWDGLRRRTTVLEPGNPSLRKRQKSLHPPLGMSEFPSDGDSLRSDDGDSLHPGFFSRLSFRRRAHSELSEHSPGAPVPLKGMSAVSRDKSLPPSPHEGLEHARSHIFGLPSPLSKEHNEDTAYKSQSSSQIQWAEEVGDETPKSRGSLAPPKPPPHTARRQFSFQNVFGRSRREEESRDGESSRPSSRPALSFHSRKHSHHSQRGGDGATEEERLGLVKGDSSHALPLPEYTTSPPEYSDTDDDYQAAGSRRNDEIRVISPGGGSSAAAIDRSQLPQFNLEPRRRKDHDDDDDDDRYDSPDAKEFEGKSGGGGAFV